jgi:hypothetical protein
MKYVFLYFRLILHSICSQHLTTSRKKRNRITVFSFFNPGEIIKNSFYFTSSTKNDGIRSVCNVTWFGKRVRSRREGRVTQSFRHSIAQESYFHWHCPNSRGNFCPQLNHFSWIVLSREVGHLQLLSSITERKYISYWSWKQECSLSLTNSSWYTRSRWKLLIYLMYRKSVCERLPSV